MLEAASAVRPQSRSNRVGTLRFFPRKPGPLSMRFAPQIQSVPSVRTAIEWKPPRYTAATFVSFTITGVFW